MESKTNLFNKFRITTRKIEEANDAVYPNDQQHGVESNGADKFKL